ncbi:MAG: aspartate-semialdehyde dehydrogenase [candidate division KSB1 bacterium]|nr:aspartate-semialdehyde dehydrogenase [candidate division KSB1 bacterium]MDZ7335956.1 aspartate-semialdehyde dehydrogenase [candidate division KSB1 bacterium]MDZ7357922.1 aspartate-semialdehyde dehydrogenase [candidate division KSB1 bacterium]MDZ7402177.1 aspartate-semialdehyde dehydrogenase [candidate division KSB1 bacterium]
MIDKKLLEDIIQKHYAYLKGVNFQGWDVLDGLNSRLFQELPFHKNKYVRLAWIQFFRKSPINLRSICQVPKGDNPKALALFISSLLRLGDFYRDTAFFTQALALYDRLMALRSNGYAGLCWGYNFDWQALAFHVPKFKPNMICSVFAGQALLDLFERIRNDHFLAEAKQVAEFIHKNLLLINENDRLCFGYIPGESAVIHNVNLMGAAFLARLYHVTNENDYQFQAERSVRFSAAGQRDDGAWPYGQRGHHQWVDNFHTGYNLMAIHDYQTYCQDDQFEPVLRKGLDFHLKRHFTAQLLPKYSDVRLYPLDVHCFAQAIITFLALRSYIPDYRVRVQQMIANALDILWDKKLHYFYYKKSRFFKSKIPYIRWSQAWMFYAFTYFLAGWDE